MASDPRVALARRLQREINNYTDERSNLIAQRNELIRRLRSENPRVWTYNVLARAVGCSPELIAAIVHERRGTL